MRPKGVADGNQVNIPGPAGGDGIQPLSVLIGLDRLRFIHFNDSKKGLDCRVDRHQHIGQGGIGLEGFRAFLNHPAFRDVPMVLETPKDTPADDPRNLKIMRDLAGR